MKEEAAKAKEEFEENEAKLKKEAAEALARAMASTGEDQLNSRTQ